MLRQQVLLAVSAPFKLNVRREGTIRRDLAVALIAFVGCTHVPMLPAQLIDLGQSGYDCESTAQGIVDLHNQADEQFLHYRREHYDQPLREWVDFDPNSYFGVLKHLRLPEGKVLDYVYNPEPGGGAPVLYIRHETVAPFTAYEDYVSACGGRRAARLWRERLPEELVLDGTPESLFELVVLDVLGGQFCLNWHSNYFDTRMVTTRNTLDRTVEELEAETTLGRRITPEEKEQALAIDPTPVVGFSGDTTAVVRVLTFSKFRGFNQIIYEIATLPPHRIMRKTTRTLVEYHCGIIY
jgi:hypothetical protein